MAGRLAPQDIVQSVFRSFFRRAGAGTYDAPEGGELWGLLLIMALHKVRGQGAYHRAPKRDVGRTSGDSVSNQAEHSNEQAFTELRLCINEILTSHTPTERAIIELRIDGFQVADIAARTKRSKRSVERVLQQFRKLLKSEVDDSAEWSLRSVDQLASRVSNLRVASP